MATAAQSQQEAPNDDPITAEEQARIAREAASTSSAQSPGARTLEAIIDATQSRRAEELRINEGMFAFQQRRAKLFASSGLFVVKGVTGDMAVAQAMVKIELGEAMGFTPAESLQGINIINGVTSISSAMRASKMQAAGYGWRIQWLGPRDTCMGCRLWLYKDGRPVMQPIRNDDGEPVLDTNRVVQTEQVSEAFTEADALKMMTTMYVDDPNHPGVFEKKTKKSVSILEKDNWKMSKRNMYFARAVTNLQRFYAPHVLNINIPSTEELQDMDEQQTVVQTVKPQPATASISLSNIKPSADTNRGHDETAAKADPTAVPDLKHLGGKDGYPVYNRFPAPETVKDGQLIWIRTESGDELYESSESFGNQFIQCDPVRIQVEKEKKAKKT